MPSLLHISSTQSELGNCNVNYFEFDNDLSSPASVDDQVNTNDDSVTNLLIEKCSFQRNTICLPPDVAFQVHLLSQMNKHRKLIVTCLMKSFDVSRHMPSIITWITQCCRHCQESNLYSCWQNTINLISSSQHYICCPLLMDLLLLCLYLMSKPLWLHFLIIPWECTSRTLCPIMISLQETQNNQHQHLIKYTLDHFGSRLEENTVVMIYMHFP